MSGDLDRSFAGFAGAALPGLRRVAYLMSGDWHRADDLTQTTLERMYTMWPRLGFVDDPEAYARRVLTRICFAENRRLWRRRETVWADPTEATSQAALVSGDRTLDELAGRLDVHALLASLPPRQRAVVILRYLEDRPVDQVAQLLDVSAGTVKRHSHDALRRLRAQAGGDTDKDPDPAAHHGRPAPESLTRGLT